MSDLAIFSFGIFPFFEYASSAIRCEVLEIIIRFFIPLDTRLSVCLQSLILAILPGIEEESSECYLKSLKTLMAISKAVTAKAVTRKIWTAMIMSSKHRISAINYFSKIQTRKISDHADAINFCAEKLDLAIGALCISLEDKQTLVVRGTLDIILNHFPLTCEWLDYDQKLKLINAAVNVFLRRDMSLSRRVNTWLTQINFTENAVSDEIIEPVKNLIVESINQMLNTSHLSFETLLKPYKILAFINEKPQIIKPILQKLIFTLIEPLSHFCLTHPNLSEKAISSSNRLFGVLDLYQIWGTFTHHTINQDSDDLFQKTSKIIIFGLLNLKICEDEAAYSLIPSYMIVASRHASAIPALSLTRSIDLINLITACIEKFNIRKDVVSESAYLINDESLNRIVSKLPSLDLYIYNGQEIIKYTLRKIFSTASNALEAKFTGNSCFVNLQVHELLAQMFNLLSKVMCLENLEQDTLIDSFNSFECRKYIDTIHSIIERYSSILVANHIVDICVIIYENYNQELDSVDCFVKPIIKPTLRSIWNLTLEDSENIPIASKILCSLYEHEPTIIDIFFTEKLKEIDIEEQLVLNINSVFEVWFSSVTQNNCPNNFLSNTIIELVSLVDDIRPEISFTIKDYLSRASPFIARILYPYVQILINALSDLLEPQMYYVPFYKSRFNSEQICYALGQLLSIFGTNLPSISHAISTLSFSPEVSNMIYSNLQNQYLPKTNNADKFIDQIQISRDLILIITPFICAESVGAVGFIKQRIDYIQATAQKVIYNIICNLDALGVAEMSVLYKILLEKMQYIQEIESFKGLNLTLNLLEASLQKLTLFNGKGFSFNPKPATEASFLSKIVSTIFKKCDDYKILVGLTEFLCRSISYYDECLTWIIEPQCQILIQKLHMLISDSTEKEISQVLDRKITETINLIGELYITAISPEVESERLLSRSGSNATMRPTFLAPVTKPEMSLIPKSHLNRDLSPELRTNSVTHTIPYFYAEVSRILSIDQPKRIKLKCQKSAYEMCEKIYKKNSPSIVYLLLEYLGTRIDLSSENQLIVDSPIKNLMCMKGPFSTDLLKTINMVYRSVRDTRGEVYGKISLESVALALYYVCDSNSTIKGYDEVMDAATLLNILARDTVGNATRFKQSIYLNMASYISIFKFAAKNFSAEEKKSLRETIEMFYRILEIAVVLASKSCDLALWTAPNSRLCDEDAYSPDIVSSLAREKSSGKTLAVIFWSLIPFIELAVWETEKLSSLITSILNQLIIPSLKVSFRNQTPGYIALCGLGKLASQPSLTKYWKKEFWEYIFLDQLFFNCSLASFKTYIVQMKEFLNSEPDRIGEIISKVPSSNSTNLFLSREIDAYNRAMMIRRLSMICFCADITQLKIYMPSMQEKIVDNLKLGIGAASPEIYYLIRIIFYRLGEEFPLTTWPVIITELMSLYKSILGNLSPSSVMLSKILQASRLVDDVMMSGNTTPML